MPRRLVSRCLLLYGIICLSCPAHAASDAAALHDKKTQLARDFVSRLKNKLTGGESAADSQADSQVPASRDFALSQIPEGQDLLFRPRVEKYVLDGNIFTLKGADDFYLSLSDLVAAFNFPITLSDDQKSAAGWFVSEGWGFRLDTQSNTASARGETYTLTEKDYQFADGDLMISGRLAQQMLGMRYDYDVSQQYIEVDTDYALPVIAQMKRRNRKNARHNENIAVLPRKDYEYDMASLASADLSLRSNYVRRGSTQRGNLSNTANIGLNGQLLKNDARVFASMDDDNGLNVVTARLSRESDRPELLGPLKARSYALGDTDTVSIPLTGQSAQELGVRVSSNPLTYINYQDTRISGNALPGWDVELYRENSLLGTLVVDETGRFEFDNVQLYAGDNNFEIYFYGYQGEVRKESLSIPLTAETLMASGGTYDFSATLNDSAVYRRQISDDEDRDTPHVAGKYNFFVGDALAYAGFRGWQEAGEPKLYLGTGATNIWNGFVFDTNLAVDEDAEMAGRLGIRKNINDWNLAWSTQLQTDEFSEGVATDNPATLRTMGSIYRYYTPFTGGSGSFSLSGDYREYADGGSAHGASLGLSHGFRGVSLSNSLRYDESSPMTGATTEKVVDDFSARVRLSQQVSTRAGLSYQIRPDSQMDRYFANVNYRPHNNLDLDFNVEHEPVLDHTEGEVRANYTHDHFRVSPFVRLDSDNDFTAGFNLSTSLVNVPGQNQPALIGRALGQGMLAAHVFLDANGNLVFDEGDEPLPDVVVESLNSRAREKTKENGRVLLPRLASNIVTDIRVDNATLPDAFMISVNKGNSVLPRAGKVYDLEFPIQFSGEADGTIAVTDPGGGTKLARSVGVSLIPLDSARQETLKVKAGQDGFFLFSQVPPGRYFLTVDAADAKLLKAARPMPKILTFTHEGTMLYAQDTVLQQGRHDIGFEMLPVGYFPGVTTTEPEYYISVAEDDKSGLLQAFYRMRMKDVVGRVVAGLPPVDTGSGAIYYRVGPGGLANAYQRCEIMSAHRLPCQVSVLPAGAGPMPGDEAADRATRQAAL